MGTESATAKLLGDPLLFVGKLEEISGCAGHNGRDETVMMGDGFFHRHFTGIAFGLTTSFLLFFLFVFRFLRRILTRRLCLSVWLIRVVGSQVDLPVFKVIGSHPEGLAANWANVGLLARVQC